MTVRELIEKLQTFPQHAIACCVYLCCSDYVILEADDLTYHPVEKPVKGPFGDQHRYVLHHGKIMEYDEKTWPKDVPPPFVPVVAFPGN